MPVIKLECSCGKVRGETAAVSSASGNRIVCCCSDCQSFARYLGKEESVLDQYGGTDIFQMPISQLKITEGAEHIACVRLTAKGLYRWYASCCHTPIGNTMGASMPFVGVIHNFMQHKSNRDEELGKNRGYVQTGSALQEIPASIKGSSFSANVRLLGKLLAWKLKGLNKPSAFFDSHGLPLAKPEILN